MSKTKNTADSDHRRVALLVESSVASGRQLLRGVAEYVREVGHWSIYCEPSHLKVKLPDWLKHWHGDGIIVRVMNKSVAKRIAKMGIPVVAVQGSIFGEDIPFVQVDDRTIAESIANYLLEHRLRSFGFCGLRDPYWSRLRRDCFQTTLAKFGFETHLYELPSRYGKAWFFEDKREQLAHWVSRLPKPVGIMACNDWAGQRVLDACRRAKVMVPEEVAVIGVDNDEMICELCDPMLSSVIAGHDRVGYFAAQLLDQLMQGKKPPKEPVIVGSPRIVVRRSTDLQTIADRDVAAAVRYIRENACRGISVQDVAAHVALSYSTLYRRFQQVLKRPINDEIMRVRMERVRELLVESKMPISQITHIAGFNHQEYLGAVFKSQTGMTLGQFRSKNANKSMW
jgi:LacI family transcriptional regulator